MSLQHASILAIAVGLATGCAEHLRSVNRSASWSTGVVFWPPPSGTSTWLAEPSPPIALDHAATLVESLLRRAGYSAQRWYPIGAHYEHGFAVTTRLERIDDDGRPRAAIERYVPAYPEAATLRWLGDSAVPYLPKTGRYRVFLIAFTDLHVSLPSRAQRWNEETAMDGPDFPTTDVPTRWAPAGCRIGVYVYEYETTTAEGGGTFVREDGSTRAATHAERSGLALLGKLTAAEDGR